MEVTKENDTWGLWNEKTFLSPPRDVILKAVDLWIHQQVKHRLPYHPDSDVNDDKDDDNNNDNDNTLACVHSSSPHDMELCEMCSRYNRQCTALRNGRR